jgi:hypothetical protein
MEDIVIHGEEAHGETSGLAGLLAIGDDNECPQPARSIHLSSLRSRRGRLANPPSMEPHVLQGEKRSPVVARTDLVILLSPALVGPAGRV